MNDFPFRTKTDDHAHGAWVDQVRERVHTRKNQETADRIAGGHWDVYPALTHILLYHRPDGRLVFVLKEKKTA